jgi:hypothetical protein
MRERVENEWAGNQTGEITDFSSKNRKSDAYLPKF